MNNRDPYPHSAGEDTKFVFWGAFVLALPVLLLVGLIALIV